MYKVMVTPPIVYVKVQEFLNSRAFASMCDELRAQHDELDGKYDSIFIDLGDLFEFDFNFRNETRTFLQLVREHKKHLVILNPTAKMVNGINKQGLSTLMKVKNLKLSTSANPAGEFQGKAKVQVKEEEVAALLDGIAAQVFTAVACDKRLLGLPSPILPPGEVFSMCQMVNDDVSALLGLKFNNKAIIAGLIAKMARGTEINLASMQRWTDEILNMFISQIAVSKPNQQWNLTKVGQPASASDPRLTKLATSLKTHTLAAYSELGIELVYQVSAKVAADGKESSPGWVKNPAV